MKINPKLAVKILHEINKTDDGICSLSAKEFGLDNYVMFAMQLDLMKNWSGFISGTEPDGSETYFQDRVTSPESKVEMMITDGGLEELSKSVEKIG